MFYLLADGTEIKKIYLDPNQAYPKDRNNLVKVAIWPSDKKKSEVTFKAGKKEVTVDGKKVEVDGDVELK